MSSCLIACRFIGSDEQQITTMYACLSLQDFYSGNRTWGNIVTSGMQAFTSQFGVYPGKPRDNGDDMWVLEMCNNLAFF